MLTFLLRLRLFCCLNSTPVNETVTPLYMKGVGVIYHHFMTHIWSLFDWKQPFVGAEHSLVIIYLTSAVSPVPVTKRVWPMKQNKEKLKNSKKFDTPKPKFEPRISRSLSRCEEHQTSATPFLDSGWILSTHKNQHSILINFLHFFFCPFTIFFFSWSSPELLSNYHIWQDCLHFIPSLLEILFHTFFETSKLITKKNSWKFKNNMACLNLEFKCFPALKIIIWFGKIIYLRSMSPNILEVRLHLTIILL